MLLRGLGPARFKEAELIRVFAWKQRQGWPSVYRGLGRGGVGEGRGNLRRWCRAAATSRDTRLRSSWHEPSWHVFPLGLSLRPPFHALPRCTLAPQSAPILSLARSPSLLLLLLRLGLRYAHVDMYIYIYNSSGTDVAVPKLFLHSEGDIIWHGRRYTRRGRLCSTCGSAFLDRSL